MIGSRAGSDYCTQCRGEFTWHELPSGGPTRLYCACQWAARLRTVDHADLVLLRERNDPFAEAELQRRMIPKEKSA